MINCYALSGLLRHIVLAKGDALRLYMLPLQGCCFAIAFVENKTLGDYYYFVATMAANLRTFPGSALFLQDQVLSIFVYFFSLA